MRYGMMPQGAAGEEQDQAGGGPVVGAILLALLMQMLQQSWGDMVRLICFFVMEVGGDNALGWVLRMPRDPLIE